MKQNDFKKTKMQFVRRNLWGGLFVLLLLTSCHTAKPRGKQLGEHLVQIGLIAKIGRLSNSSDGYKVEQATIKGNELLLTVSYHGDPTSDSFSFQGSEAVAKSYPPQRVVQLVINRTKNESSKDVKLDFKIQLNALAYEKVNGSKIILVLQNYEGGLEYVYQEE